jgi:hypothetical protein
MFNVASWKMSRPKHPWPFTGLVKTSPQQQSCSAPCRSHPPSRTPNLWQNSGTLRVCCDPAGQELSLWLREPASEHQAGPSRFERETSVDPKPTQEKAPAVQDRLQDNHQHRRVHDYLGGRVHHNNRRHETRGYHPWRGGRYDNGED